MLCFDKLTSEHNNKKHLKNFHLWNNIFNVVIMVSNFSYLYHFLTVIINIINNKDSYVTFNESLIKIA